MMWLVYRDAKLQLNSNEIGWAQKFISSPFKKTNIFKIHSQQKLLNKKRRQFVLQLLRKLIAPAISQTKS